MELNFEEAKSKKDIEEILNYNIDAFTDSPGFSWDLEGLREEMKQGWHLYSVRFQGEEIIAAILFKKDGNKLYTKNTTVKAHHQGSGYNHQIKDFFELKAKELKVQEIYHLCRIENFRMYSLNESHGYTKLDQSPEGGQIVEWVKYLD